MPHDPLNSIQFANGALRYAAGHSSIGLLSRFSIIITLETGSRELCHVISLPYIKFVFPLICLPVSSVQARKSSAGSFVAEKMRFDACYNPVFC